MTKTNIITEEKYKEAQAYIAGAELVKAYRDDTPEELIAYQFIKTLTLDELQELANAEDIWSTDHIGTINDKLMEVAGMVNEKLGWNTDFEDWEPEGLALSYTTPEGVYYVEANLVNFLTGQKHQELNDAIDCAKAYEQQKKNGTEGFNEGTVKVISEGLEGSCIETKGRINLNEELTCKSYEEAKEGLIHIATILANYLKIEDYDADDYLVEEEATLDESLQVIESKLKNITDRAYEAGHWRGDVQDQLANAKTKFGERVITRNLTMLERDIKSTENTIITYQSATQSNLEKAKEMVTWLKDRMDK